MQQINSHEISVCGTKEMYNYTRGEHEKSQICASWQNMWYSSLVFKVTGEWVHNMRLEILFWLTEWQRVWGKKGRWGLRGYVCVCYTEGLFCFFLLQPLKLHYHDWSLSASQGHTHPRKHCRNGPVFIRTQVISLRKRTAGKMCAWTDLLTHVAGLEPLCRGMLMFSKETISQQRKIGAWTNTHREEQKEGGKETKNEWINLQ